MPHPFDADSSLYRAERERELEKETQSLYKEIARLKSNCINWIPVSETSLPEVSNNDKWEAHNGFSDIILVWWDGGVNDKGQWFAKYSHKSGRWLVSGRTGGNQSCITHFAYINKP